MAVCRCDERIYVTDDYKSYTFYKTIYIALEPYCFLRYSYTVDMKPVAALWCIQVAQAYSKSSIQKYSMNISRCCLFFFF